MSMGLHSNSRTSNSDWLYSGNNWLNMGSISISMGLGSIQGAGLAGNRSLDWVADFSGHWVALFNWNLDTDSLWNSSGDGGTGLSGHLGALGNSNTVGNSDTVWGGDSFGNWNTNWDSNTVRNRHTSWNSNSSGRLDWDLSALSVNLLLTLSASWDLGNSNWGNSSNSWGTKSNWGNSSNSRGSSKRSSNSSNTKWSSTKEELSISISFRIGLTLDNSLGERVQSKSSNKRTNSSSWGNNSSSLGNSNRSSSNSWGSSNSWSGSNSRDSSWGSNSWSSGNNWSMGNNLLLDSDISDNILADLSHDVLALLGEGCLWDDLGLSGALLGLCALLLGGALLLLDHGLDVLTLLLSGALGLIHAHLLGDSLTHLLGDLLDEVGALLLCGSGALLFGDLNGDGDTLLLGGGGALLPGLSVGLWHTHGSAHILTDSVADLVCHGVIHGPALGGIVMSVMVAGVSSVTITRVSICITQSKG